MRGAWIAAAAAILSGCGESERAPASLPCKAADRECAVKALRAHPAKTRAYWKDAMSRPLAERIGPAGSALVQFLALDNIANGFPEHPRAATPTPDFAADVRRALEELPEPVKRPLAAKLAGIYFVEDMGSTGFTDQVLNAAGKPDAAFVLLDPKVLRAHTANSWATWRDSTPFRPDPCCRLEETLATGAEDNRKNAIQYILLHELAHVLSVGGDIHPDWTVEPQAVGPTARFAFFELSWTLPPGESRWASRFDAQWPRRRDIVYYLGPKLGGDEMVPAYEALERTNFATLYSATSPGDDFAEAFANYVHTVLMRKPFEVRLLRDGKVAKRYGACWEEPRCADKRRMIEALLAR